MIVIRSLVRNYIVLLFGELIARFLTFVTFVYLARALGPAGFGIIEFCFAHVLILSFMVDFGVGVLGAREVAQKYDQIKQITQRMVSVRFWSMISSMALLVFYAVLSPQPWSVKSLLLLFAVSLFPMPYQFQWVFLGRNWMQYVSISQVLRYGVFAGIVLATVRDSSSMWVVAAAEFAGVLAAAIFSILSFRLKIGFWPPSLPVVPAWAVIKQVVPVALSHFMWLAKYVFVTVVVGFLAGLEKNPEQVGHFGAAVRIIVTMHVFVSLYLRNLLPSVSQAVNGTMESLRVLLDHAIRASAWLSLFGSMLLVIVAPQVIQIVYGDAYSRSVIILQILIWMIPAALVSAHYRVTLIAASRQGLEMLSTAIGAVVTLTLVIVFYHRFGLNMVAVAMVIGEVSTLVFSFVFMRRYVVSARFLRCVLLPVATMILAAALLLVWPYEAVWAKVLLLAVFFGLSVSLLDPALLAVFRASAPYSLHNE
jgi:O-antigen/teichoic acid export membrane protein